MVKSKRSRSIKIWRARGERQPEFRRESKSKSLLRDYTCSRCGERRGRSGLDKAAAASSGGPQVLSVKKSQAFGNPAVTVGRGAGRRKENWTRVRERQRQRGGSGSSPSLSPPPATASLHLLNLPLLYFQPTLPQNHI